MIVYLQAYRLQYYEEVEQVVLLVIIFFKKKKGAVNAYVLLPRLSWLPLQSSRGLVTGCSVFENLRPEGSRGRDRLKAT
jgi:hypothetical protein